MSTLKVGDKIRILEEGLESARVVKGDVLEVLGVYNEYTFVTEAPRITSHEAYWWFGFENEGTGWELYEEAGE